MRKTLAIGDAHFPWVSEKTLEQIFHAIEREKPKAIIQMGDLFDLYSYSKFARTHDLCTPVQEINEARAMAEGFWKQVRKLLGGRGECYQIKGNHDSRIVLRAQEKYPEITSLLNIDHLWKFPGITTVDDVRQPLKIDGVNFIHGHYGQLGAHMRYFLESVVCGHTHRGGVLYMRRNKKILFELNVGFIADESAVPLQYTKTKTTLWTPGYGLIDEHGPRFCPIPG